MAVTINASTSAGLVQSADLTGALAFQNNGVTALTLDASQNALFVAGATFNGAFSGSYSHGTVLDYATGNARVTAGPADGITFYNGGPSSRATLMGLSATGYMTGVVGAGPTGLYQASQYYRLNAAYAGSNATGAQSAFGVGVTLLGSTTYEFEGVIALNKTAGTTSHTIALGFGGTATLNNIGYYVENTAGTANQFNALQGSATAANISSTTFITAATATVLTGAITTATVGYVFIVKGTVSINAGGTFIPQYTLSAAPGGSYSTAIGSYFKLSPLAASGSNVSIGTWA